MKCPGQDTQYWTDGAIYEVDCPKCSKAVEFYKDDTNRKCHHCGHRFVNPKMDFGCAAYCQFAEQCIGTLPEEFSGALDNLLKDKVAVEVKRTYKNDFHAIGHATRVARYAEQIGKAEGGNLAVILCAAYLHDLDSSRGSLDQDSASGSAARTILTKLQAKPQITEQVLDLIVNQQSPSADNIEQRILHDAILLAFLEESQKEGNNDQEQFPGQYKDAFTTTTGQNTAHALLPPG